MLSSANVLLCGFLALVLWGGPGWLLARGLGAGRGAACALAPALGWATQTAAGLAIAIPFGLVGGVTALIAAGLCAGAGVLLGSMREDPGRAGAGVTPPAFPAWVLVLAAALALVPALAVLPKTGADGAIAFAAPIYDHAKIALIDEIAGHGVLPPANPVYGAGGADGSVAYYYLWQFGAAELAVLADAQGWEADAAASWFSAFAALCLVAGLGFRFRPGRAAPLFAVLAASVGSLRPVAKALMGPGMDQLIEPATGLGHLLFQASWSPHHVAAASSCVLAVLLLARLRGTCGFRRGGLLIVITALVVAAGFESSLWVGGVTFALAGGAAALALTVSGPAEGRGRFVAALAAVAILAGIIVAPLLMAQLHAAADRGGGVPILVEPFPVLGPWVPEGWMAVLNAPAFWLVLLPLEFPALAFAGAAGVALVVRGGEEATRRLAWALGGLALVSLLVSASLVSTAGENNDLGWRAVLPALLVLAAFSGAALAVALERRRSILMAALLLIALGLPDTLALLGRNAVGEMSADGCAFARDPELWQAVRREVGADVRIASNPERLQKLTPWPINLSWALLSHRRSCFAGNEMALAFAPLDAKSREEAAALFARVFSGAGTPAEVAELRTAFGCGAVVVTAQDGAWRADPFAGSGLYRLAREEDGRWRIYVAADGVVPAAR